MVVSLHATWRCRVSRHINMEKVERKYRRVELEDE